MIYLLRYSSLAMTTFKQNPFLFKYLLESIAKHYAQILVFILAVQVWVFY